MNKEKYDERIQDLKDRAILDSTFDNKLLIDYTFTNTQNLIWWIGQRLEWTQAFHIIEKKRKEAYRKTYEYYKKDYPLNLTTKDEISAFVDSDVNYCNVLHQSILMKEAIKYIDSVIESLKSLAFEVKNAIQWELFKNGR